MRDAVFFKKDIYIYIYIIIIDNTDRQYSVRLMKDFDSPSHQCARARARARSLSCTLSWGWTLLLFNLILTISILARTSKGNVTSSKAFRLPQTAAAAAAAAAAVLLRPKRSVVGKYCCTSRCGHCNPANARIQESKMGECYFYIYIFWGNTVGVPRPPASLLGYHVLQHHCSGYHILQHPRRACSLSLSVFLSLFFFFFFLFSSLQYAALYFMLTCGL